MATATLIMIAPCASGSTWKNVCYRVRCCHLGVCDKLPDYAGVRQMKQEASETGFLKDGHVIMLSLIGYTLNKQTNERKHKHTDLWISDNIDSITANTITC